MASVGSPMTPSRGMRSPSPLKGSPQKSRSQHDEKTTARGCLSPSTPLTSPSSNSKNISPGRKNVTVPKGVCVFCLRKDENDDLYGKKLTRKSMTCHHFCLLFASGLMQFGKSDTEGLLGFLPRDILKEYRRARRLRCAYCSNVGATVGCALGKCRVTFHLPCGAENGVLSQFYGTFSSFCPEHRPVQKVVASTASAISPVKDIHTCAICMSAVTAKPSPTSLCTPCCKNAWYHRSCMQNQAKYSGVHFFKCPLCNNKDKFQKEMLQFGIYIPDQDAAWELEENAFQDLLHRHNRCDQRKCRCPRGRTFTNKKWTVLLCDACGSVGAHSQCAEIKSTKARWNCPDCKKLLGSTKKKSPGAESKLNIDPSKFQSLYPGPSGIQKKRKRISDGSDDQPRKKNKKSAEPPMEIQYRMQRPLLPRRQWRLRQGQEEEEVVPMDLKNQPIWLQRLLQDDIFTGANLGRKLADFRFCKPGEEPPLPLACKEAVRALGPRSFCLEMTKLEVKPSQLVLGHLQRLHADKDRSIMAILERCPAEVATHILNAPSSTDAEASPSSTDAETAPSSTDAEAAPSSTEAAPSSTEAAPSSTDAEAAPSSTDAEDAPSSSDADAEDKDEASSPPEANGCKAKVQLDFTKINQKARFCRRCSKTLFPFDEHDRCVQHRRCGLLNKNRTNHPCSVCITWPPEKFQMLKQEMEKSGVIRLSNRGKKSVVVASAPSSTTTSTPTILHSSPARLTPRRHSNSPYRTRTSLQSEATLDVSGGSAAGTSVSNSGPSTATSTPTILHSSPARLTPRRHSNSPYRTRTSLQSEATLDCSGGSAAGTSVSITGPAAGTPVFSSTMSHQPTPQSQPVAKILPPVPTRVVRSNSAGRKSRRLPIVSGQRSISAFLQPSPEMLLVVTSPPMLSPPVSMATTSVLSCPPLPAPQQPTNQDLTPDAIASSVSEPGLSESIPRQSSILQYVSPVSEPSPPASLPRPQPCASRMECLESCDEQSEPPAHPPTYNIDESDSDDEVQIVNVLAGPMLSCTCRRRYPAPTPSAAGSPLLPIQKQQYSHFSTGQLYPLAAARPPFVLPRSGSTSTAITAITPSSISHSVMIDPMAPCKPRSAGKENLVYTMPANSMFAHHF